MLKTFLAGIGLLSIGLFLGSWATPQHSRLNIGDFVRVEMVTDDTGLSVPTVIIEGANLQVVNGTGSTKKTNGAGNIIIGYNETYEVIFPELPDGNPEPPFPDERTGSHNLVMGRTQNYNEGAYGNIITGTLNRVAGPHNALLSSFGAGIDAGFSSVIGTQFGAILGFPSFANIFGGDSNATTTDFGTVVGGQGNFINGPGGVYGTVAGGNNRTVFTSHAFGTAGGINIQEN